MLKRLVDVFDACAGLIFMLGVIVLTMLDTRNVGSASMNMSL